MELRIYLRALELEDYLTTIEWRKEDDLWDNLTSPRRFVSTDTEKRWIEKSILEHEKGEKLRFLACNKQDHEIVGLITAFNLDFINRKCRVSTFIDKKFRSHGYANEFRLLVYHHLFSDLGMQRLEGIGVETNIASINASKKFGFVEEGRQRKSIFKRGKFYDLVMLSLLRSEFYELYGMVFNSFDLD